MERVNPSEWHSMAAAQMKAWKTRRKKKWRTETGSTVWAHRKELMLKTKTILRKWKQEAQKGVCVVCGDGMKIKSILQIHHLDPDTPSEGTVLLCGSCHNIFNKAHKTTTHEEVIRDLNFRHRSYCYNVKQSGCLKT